MGGGASSPFNLLLMRPVHSNSYGQLYEAKPEDHKQQLQDLDLALTIANITRGSMMGPFYNSRSTRIVVVLEGEGLFEMASCGRRSKRILSYHGVRADLSPGTLFIAPAGHPVAVASTHNNLLLLCFEVNAQGSIRYPVAGKNNIISMIEKEAKELAFGVEGREVEQIFGNQNEELFYPGPRMQHREDDHAFA